MEGMGLELEEGYVTAMLSLIGRPDCQEPANTFRWSVNFKRAGERESELSG